MNRTNSLSRTTERYYLQEFHNANWLLNVYLIKSSQDEIVPRSEMHKLIDKHLAKLEQTCISTEFDYYRTGFAFLHYGNRGVDLTIWHYGKWGNTFETYCCSWYCYGRDVDNMELLDSAEPVICQYEILHFIREIEVAGKIVSVDANTFRERYRSCYAAETVF